MTAPALASTEAPTLREIVASEMRAQLARRQMSGRELARLLREQQTWVSRRLKADIPSSTDDIERICSALGISAERLMMSAFAAAAQAEQDNGSGVHTAFHTGRYSPGSADPTPVLTLVADLPTSYSGVSPANGSSVATPSSSTAPLTCIRHDDLAACGHSAEAVTHGNAA